MSTANLVWTYLMMMKSLLKMIAEKRMENAKSRRKRLIKKRCRMNMIVQRMTTISLKVNKALALMMMNLVKRTWMVQMRT